MAMTKEEAIARAREIEAIQEKIGGLFRSLGPCEGFVLEEGDAEDAPCRRCRHLSWEHE